ncbi:MAG: hypothetical protein K5633_01865 [Paludibacteraceae bacterium]|nr:hypothetical protein [Paludibacteraceae bacterium]
MKKIIAIVTGFLVTMVVGGQVNVNTLKKVSQGADTVAFALPDTLPRDSVMTDTLMVDSLVDTLWVDTVKIDTAWVDTVKYDSTELDYVDVQYGDTIFKDGYVRILTDYFVTEPELWHQISFRLVGGYFGLSYDPSHGSSEMGWGWSERLEYKYWYWEDWAIGTGLYISSYGARCRVSGYTSEEERYDQENNAPFMFYSAYDGVREQQRMFEAEIPVGGYYRREVATDFSFVGGAGMKFGIPISTKYRYKGGTCTTTAYYPSTGVVYHDLPQHGLTTYQAKEYTGDVDFGSINLSVYLDLGMTYRLNKLVNLYAGLYTAFGLLDLNPKTAVGDGMVSIMQRGESGKVKTFEFGLSVGADLNLGKGMKKTDLYN